MNILGAITQRAAAKVKGNDLQSVRTQCVRVQDFKHGAENDIRVGARSIVDAPEAGRNEPANRTERRVVSCCVLPPRIYAIPVFDVAAVLVQHCVPFVALGHAALGIARTCSVTSHRRCAQGIVHAAAGIIFAENQTFVIQAIPAYRMRYGIVRHKQAVGIFILLCILLGGCHLRCELVGIHRACIGKRHIMQGAVRQIAVYRSGNIHCRKVKIISAAGGEGELLVNRLFHRQRNVCEITCVIGIIIAVALLAEHLEGIVARRKVGRDFDFNRSCCFGGLRHSAVILCAAVIRKDDGDIFICPCGGRPTVMQRNGITGVAAGGCFRHGKIAATI